MVSISESRPPATPVDWARIVHWARLAPSSHNSQPWRFIGTGKALTVVADWSRRLPVVDPDDRELYISCGAAVEFAALALRCEGFVVRTELEDRIGEANVAMLTIQGEAPTPALERMLFDAIPLRRTSRVAFDMMPIPKHLEEALRATCNDRRVSLHTIADQESRQRLVDLIMMADRRQMSDPSFRRELARWLRPARSHQPDGMHGDAVGVGKMASYAAPLVLRTFDMGDRQAARDRELIDASPLLVVMATDRDCKEAWIRAGQALARMTLRAAAEGFTASYLNQPIECEPLRQPLADLVVGARYPQLLLRIGRAPGVPSSTRRSVDDVYTEDPVELTWPSGRPVQE